jgi:hypothetical protein
LADGPRWSEAAIDAVLGEAAPGSSGVDLLAAEERLVQRAQATAGPPRRTGGR